MAASPQCPPAVTASHFPSRMLFKADVVMLMTSLAQEAFCVWRNRRCEKAKRPRCPLVS